MENQFVTPIRSTGRRLHLAALLCGLMAAVLLLGSASMEIHVVSPLETDTKNRQPHWGMTVSRGTP